MKTTPRLLAVFSVFAAALFAGCSSTQVATEESVPAGKVLGTVSASGSGFTPPMGALRNQLLDEAVRQFGHPVDEIVLGPVSYEESRTIGREVTYNNAGVGEDGSRYGGYPGGQWSASAQVWLKD